jgi:hypothetical protein
MRDVDPPGIAAAVSLLKQLANAKRDGDAKALKDAVR